MQVNFFWNKRYFVTTSPHVWVQSIVMSMQAVWLSVSLSLCLFICLSVSLSARITRKPHGQTSSIFLHVACGHGSVLLWWHCDTLCTSGLTDDVIFSYHGASWQSMVLCSSPGGGASQLDIAGHGPLLPTGSLARQQSCWGSQEHVSQVGACCASQR